jgi:hypothetical protein
VGVIASREIHNLIGYVNRDFGLCYLKAVWGLSTSFGSVVPVAEPSDFRKGSPEKPLITVGTKIPFRISLLRHLSRFGRLSALPERHCP